MRIFITYAREDGTTVAQLGADLERSQRKVWIDRNLTGGQAWWEEILEQIRGCDLYVFALSASSLRSKPCLRELEYAQALGRPLLPIMVGEISIQQAPRVIADAQVVNYIGRTPDGVLALRDALDAAPSPPALPDPLPEPPGVPISYFGHYREQISADSLTFTEQQALLLELKSHLGNEDDRDDAVDLLGGLRGRHDLAQSVATEIDAILASIPPREPTPLSTSDDAFDSASTGPSTPPPTPGKKRTGLFVGIGLAAVLIVLVSLAALAMTLSENVSEFGPTTVPDTTVPDTTVPDSTVPDTTVPLAVGCPVLVDGFTLPSPETQYGPFGDGYYIVWHQVGGFSTYDPFSGLWAEFPDPDGQMARDSWQNLAGSPFQICVDTAGSVFGLYAP